MLPIARRSTMSKCPLSEASIRIEATARDSSRPRSGKVEKPMSAVARSAEAARINRRPRGSRGPRPFLEDGAPSPRHLSSFGNAWKSDALRALFSRSKSGTSYPPRKLSWKYAGQKSIHRAKEPRSMEIERFLDVILAKTRPDNSGTERRMLPLCQLYNELSFG